MQRIERYGVIALVLLLVTIAAVSFWEEDVVPPSNVRAEQSASNTLRRSTPRDVDRGLPATADRSEEARRRNQEASEKRRAQQLAMQSQRERLVRGAAAKQAAAPSGIEDLGYPEELKGEGSLVVNAPMRNTRSAGTDPDATRGQAQHAAPKMRITHKTDPTDQPAVRGGFYKVKAGQTLGRIAYETLGSSKRWPEIAALNGGSETIYEGQKLRIPARDGGATSGAVASNTISEPRVTPPKSTPKSTPKGGSTYVVRKGDMLSVIAQEKLGSARRWREIAALNPGVNPDRLLEGTKLVLPAPNASRTVASLDRGAAPKKKGRVR